MVMVDLVFVVVRYAPKIASQELQKQQVVFVSSFYGDKTIHTFTAIRSIC